MAGAVLKFKVWLKGRNDTERSEMKSRGIEEAKFDNSDK